MLGQLVVGAPAEKPQPFMMSVDLKITDLKTGAIRYADTISLLHHGRLFATGAPADVITAQTIQQVYDINASVRYESALNCLQMMVI